MTIPVLRGGSDPHVAGASVSCSFSVGVLGEIRDLKSYKERKGTKKRELRRWAYKNTQQCSVIGKTAIQTMWNQGNKPKNLWMTSESQETRASSDAYKPSLLSAFSYVALTVACAGDSPRPGQYGLRLLLLAKGYTVSGYHFPLHQDFDANRFIIGCMVDIINTPYHFSQIASPPCQEYPEDRNLRLTLESLEIDAQGIPDKQADPPPYQLQHSEKQVLLLTYVISDSWYWIGHGMPQWLIKGIPCHLDTDPICLPCIE
ncbi:hypothetical protein STEG23_029309, partial [Scotinomys teguina]